MGSAAFTGKLLQLHILLDHCTIFVVVVVILPDEQVLRKSQQVVKPVDYLSD